VSTRRDLPAKLRKRKNSKRRLELRRNVSLRTMLLAKPSSMKRPEIKPLRTRLMPMPEPRPMRKRERSVKNMKPLNSPSSKSKMPTLQPPSSPRRRPTERDKPLRMPKRPALERKSRMLKTPVMKPSARKSSSR